MILWIIILLLPALFKNCTGSRSVLVTVLPRLKKKLPRKDGAIFINTEAETCELSIQDASWSDSTSKQNTIVLQLYLGLEGRKITMEYFWLWKSHNFASPESFYLATGLDIIQQVIFKKKII